MKHYLWLLASLVFANLCPCQTAHAASLLQVGSTFTVSGTNFTTNYSQRATVGTPTLVSGGTVQLTEIVHPDGAGGEWDDFTFKTVSGGPLAGNLNSFWNVTFSGITTTQQAVWNAASIYWAVNGTAVSPITPFGSGGLSVVRTNPIDPALGPVFGAGATNRNLIEGPATSFDANPFVFVSPYSSVANGGIDPNTANELHLIFHFDPANPVPEPSSLVLLGTGSAGFCGALRRRLRGAFV